MDQSPPVCYSTIAVIKNSAVTSIQEKEKELGDNIKIEDILDEVAGVYPKIMTEGKMDDGAWSCGMVAGLIHDIPSCQDLVDGMVAEAEEIINTRLAKFIA